MQERENLIENANNVDNISNKSNTKTSKLKAVLQKIKTIFLIFNIFSLVLYSVYTFYSLYNKNKSSLFSKLLVIVLVVYVILFVYLLIKGAHDKNKLKSELKNYKSSINILKAVVKILNLSLAIMMAVHAFFSSGEVNIYLIIFGVLSIFTAVMSILLEVIKIVVRKKLAERKERNLQKKNLIQKS